MFDVSKSFSQLCLAVYEGKVDFFIYKHLKMVWEPKTAQNLSPFLLLSIFSMKEEQFENCILESYFDGNNVAAINYNFENSSDF